ncbi:MAG: hypothetical protein JXB49_00475 [Bacteroidales bacterium]|nr:hypothetical protein [Bacteroidales bacterium]
MKKAAASFFMVITLATYGQDRDALRNLMDKVNQQDTLAREVFLDSTLLQDMKLTHALNWRQIWTFADVNTKNIDQFYDIRLKFNTEAEALAFHKKYMDINSENGPEIKKHKIQIEGVKELKVFTQNATASKMFLEPNGLQALCYLFVVDNYFVKFYITCSKEYKPDYFVPYIEAAREKIRKEPGDRIQESGGE